MDASGGRAARAGTILIVEDSDDLRRLLAFALRDAGYEVTEASHGGAALEQLRRSSPALIVLDLMLPGISGLHVLAEIRKNTASVNVPVLVITGTMTFERDVQALGATALLRKPLDRDVFVNKVHDMLDLHGPAARGH